VYAEKAYSSYNGVLGVYGRRDSNHHQRLTLFSISYTVKFSHSLSSCLC